MSQPSNSGTNYGVISSGHIGGNVTSTVSVTHQAEKPQQADEVKDLIAKLQQQISDLKNQATAENTEAINIEAVNNIEGDFSSLDREAKRAEPRAAQYQVSLEGLKDAANAIGEIGTPIVLTVKKLMDLLLPA